MQVLWALILCKYNNTNDVVFGSIVSGRNVDLENVESVVGLSINMIPIRINYSVNDTLIDLLKKTQDEYIESLNYHFNPRFSKKPINSETSLLFFLFGWILIITAKWGLFITEAPWYKEIVSNL